MNLVSLVVEISYWNRSDQYIPFDNFINLENFITTLKFFWLIFFKLDRQKEFV